MAQLAMGIAGAAVGFAIGGPAGAQWGFAIGTAAGGAMFPPKLPDGPRLNDKQVQSSAYGETVPRVYGSYLLAGNVIWATDLKETAKEQSGKGGGPTYTTYSYSVSCAISLCQGPIIGIRRIFADGKLIYDARSEETDDPLADISGTVQRIGFSAQGYKIYVGDETQEPDPTIVAFEGDAPAYRGEAYIVFTDLQLEKFGNRIPQMRFEVVTGGEAAYAGPVEIFDNQSTSPVPTERISGQSYVVDPETGRLFIQRWFADHAHSVFDTNTLTVLHRFPLREQPDDDTPIRSSCFDTRNRRYIMVRFDDRIGSGIYRDYIDHYDADTYGFIKRFTQVRTVQTFNAVKQILYNPINNDLITISNKIFNDSFTVYDGVGSTTSYQYQGFNTTSGMYQFGSFLYLLELLGGATKVSIYNAISYAYIRTYDLADFFALPQNSFSFWKGDADIPQMVLDTRRNRVVAFSVFGADAPSTSFWNYVIFDVDNGTIDSSGAVELTGFSATESVTYVALTDQFVLSGSNQKIISASDFTVVRTTTGDGSGLPFRESPLYPGVLYASRNGSSSSTDGYAVYRYSIGDVVNPEVTSLKDVVAAECAQVGLTAGDIDTTRLVGNVRGFMVSGQGSGRGAIEALMNAYQFDAVESAGKLKFVSRGNAETATIEFDDLATHDVGQQVPTPLPFTRMDETTLPQKIAVKYSDSDIEFQQGAQEAARFTTQARNQVIIEVPVVMRGGEAKALAESALYSAWVGRTTTKFTVPRKYANIEPSDIVTINGNTIRIARKMLKGNMIEFEGAVESAAIYAQTPVAGLTNVTNDQMTVLTRTNTAFLDIPLLRDIDDNSSFYIGANGFEPGWPGAVIYKATDTETFFELTSVTNGAVIGGATTVLGAYDENTFDESNSVNVALVNRGTELESNTELQVLNGGNACLIGNEILQFRTATLQPDGSYTLTGLLRGRKGTLTTGHVTGDRFVLLSQSALIRPAAEDAELGLVRSYKATTIGSSIAAVSTQEFTNTGIARRPYSPVQIGGGRNASGDLTINWIRRSRINAEWRDYVDAGLGETTESYEIEVLNTSVSPAVVVRTLTATTNTVQYTAAQQTTDFSSPLPAAVTVRIYQMSSTYGRGLPAEAVL